jgi:hypothetical protein
VKTNNDDSGGDGDDDSGGDGGDDDGDDNSGGDGGDDQDGVDNDDGDDDSGGDGGDDDDATTAKAGKVLTVALWYRLLLLAASAEKTPRKRWTFC